jgi:hypothetical protein
MIIEHMPLCYTEDENAAGVNVQGEATIFPLYVRGKCPYGSFERRFV